MTRRSRAALAIALTVAVLCACSGSTDAPAGAVQLAGNGGVPIPGPVLTPIPSPPSTVPVGPPPPSAPAPIVTTRRIARAEGGDGTRPEPRLVSLEGSGNWLRLRWRIEYTAGLEPSPATTVEGRTLRVDVPYRGTAMADAEWFRETWETTVTGLDAGEWSVVSPRFQHLIELPSGGIDGGPPAVALRDAPPQRPAVRPWAGGDLRIPSWIRSAPTPGAPTPAQGQPRQPDVVDPWH